MLDTVENLLALAAAYQTCAQLQLIMYDAERRLAVGTLRRECHGFAIFYRMTVRQKMSGPPTRPSLHFQPTPAIR